MNPELNNPLRQFFRRPAIYLKLPSGGKGYAPGVINLPDNQELPVYPMTAIDEITLKTPDALFNGSAMTDVIKSCIPNIKDPWHLNSIDFQAVLIGIRTASDGNTQEINTTCPKCNEESKFDTNLIGLLSGLNYSVFEKELLVDELTIKFKALNYAQVNQININQFETQKILAEISNIADENLKAEKLKKLVIKITQATTEALCSTIEYIKTPESFVDNPKFIYEFLVNCDKKMYETIKEFSVKLKDSSNIKPFKVKCLSCSHEYEQPINLNLSDFFGIGF